MVREGKKLISVMIVLDDNALSADVNHILHDYADFIIVRCGLPYRKVGVEIITVVMEAEPAQADELTARLKKISGVNANSAVEDIVF